MLTTIETTTQPTDETPTTTAHEADAAYHHPACTTVACQCDTLNAPLAKVSCGYRSVERIVMDAMAVLLTSPGLPSLARGRAANLLKECAAEEASRLRVHAFALDLARELEAEGLDSVTDKPETDEEYAQYHAFLRDCERREERVLIAARSVANMAVLNALRLDPEPMVEFALHVGDAPERTFHYIAEDEERVFAFYLFELELTALSLACRWAATSDTRTYRVPARLADQFMALVREHDLELMH